MRVSIAASLCLLPTAIEACTNLIVTPGASEDGSSIYAYAADSAGLYGTLDVYRAKKDIPTGTTRGIYDWDSGMYLGDIEEAGETYDVVGNMNEMQLTIGETTFGGREELCQGQAGAVMDYGSLIWVALQRSRNVREALQVMTSLVARYGYASEGESFTLADPREVWVLEMIGKGQGEKGAVWVARRVPDGHITSHANQARITTFGLNDPDVLYAPDVISFAKEKGFYDEERDGPFSFSDVYDPINAVTARAGEARVWSFLSAYAAVPDFQQKYLDYVLGVKATKDDRMPWSVPVTKKLNVRDVMAHMRNHYENTPLNMTSDAGGGNWQNSFRDRPLTWSYGDSTYINERTVGTQQTGWHFVSHMRAWLPDDVGGVLWFGVDDATFSVHIPFYAFAEVPDCLKTGNGGIDTFTFQSLFWVNNLVANRVYAQWHVLAGVVSEKVASFEDSFFEKQPVEEQAAVKLPLGAARSTFLSNSSKAKAEDVLKGWTALWTQLTVGYRDGVKVEHSKPGHDHGGDAMGGPVGEVVEGSGVGNGEWPDAVKRRIIAETGDHFRVGGKDGPDAMRRKASVLVGKSSNARTVERVLEAAARQPRPARGEREAALERGSVVLV